MQAILMAAKYAETLTPPGTHRYRKTCKNCAKPSKSEEDPTYKRAKVVKPQARHEKRDWTRNQIGSTYELARQLWRHARNLKKGFQQCKHSLAVNGKFLLPSTNISPRPSGATARSLKKKEIPRPDYSFFRRSTQTSFRWKNCSLRSPKKSRVKLQAQTARLSWGKASTGPIS